jgi:hypothetical protein
MLVKGDPEPVAVTSLLDLRFQIDHKPLTELLVSMRPQTAVAIGPHYVKRESQAEPIASNNHLNR